MSDKTTYLLGVNNYCVTNHTMNKEQPMFCNKQYKLVSKAILFEGFSLQRKNYFNYDLWLIKE